MLENILNFLNNLFVEQKLQNVKQLLVNFKFTLNKVQISNFSKEESRLP